MIIGEFTNSNALARDNYDYLFKRRKREEGQPKMTRKEKHAFKRQMKKDRKAGIVPSGNSQLIRGNFGLFNKNKNRPGPLVNAEGDPNVTDPAVDGNTPDPAAAEAQANPATPAEGEPTPSEPAPGNPEPSAPEPNAESNYDEDSKKETPKPKDTGVGAYFGWVFLGITVAVIAYTLGSAGKEPHESVHEFRNHF